MIQNTRWSATSFLKRERRRRRGGFSHESFKFHHSEFKILLSRFQNEAAGVTASLPTVRSRGSHVWVARHDVTGLHLTPTLLPGSNDSKDSFALRLTLISKILGCLQFLKNQSI